MRQESLLLLVNNLVGIGLAAIAVLSITAGVYFEIMLLGLVVSIPFTLFIIFRQPKWKWRMLIIGFLAIQIYYTQEQATAGSFDLSYRGYFLDSEEIEKMKWVVPFSAGFCLTSFWTILISTLKRNKKSSPTNI